MHISVSSDDDGVDTITAYGSKKDREDSSPEPLCVKPAEIHVCPMDATDCDCPEEQERLNREAFDAVGTWGKANGYTHYDVVADHLTAVGKIGERAIWK